MASDSDKPKPIEVHNFGAPKSAVNKRLESIADKGKAVRSQVVNQMKIMDSKKTLDAVLEAPKRFKREWEKSGATGAITRFPIPTVLVFLLLTA